MNGLSSFLLSVPEWGKDLLQVVPVAMDCISKSGHAVVENAGQEYVLWTLFVISLKAKLLHTRSTVVIFCHVRECSMR